ncbi:MAG: hypothetical protein CW342_14215 [Thermoactinomycetaceae bacterium]|jgi:hypothetical protein|nr:hypothetical protein [Bacillota bacterium]MBO2534002.1 hypothetical protein [Thermoactinomycetaceae bacterium]
MPIEKRKKDRGQSVNLHNLMTSRDGRCLWLWPPGNGGDRGCRLRLLDEATFRTGRVTAIGGERVMQGRLRHAAWRKAKSAVP